MSAYVPTPIAPALPDALQGGPEVKNLPETFTQQDVTDAFKEFGELEGVKVPARAARHSRYSERTLAAQELHSYRRL